MDLIYIILISLAIVSFITGLSVRIIQKKYFNEVAEQSTEPVSINSNVEEELVPTETLEVLGTDSVEKTLTPTTTLEVLTIDDMGSKDDGVNYNVPVIVNTVVLDSYDDEIL